MDILSFYGIYDIPKEWVALKKVELEKIEFAGIKFNGI